MALEDLSLIELPWAKIVHNLDRTHVELSAARDGFGSGESRLHFWFDRWIPPFQRNYCLLQIP